MTAVVNEAMEKTELSLFFHVGVVIVPSSLFRKCKPGKCVSWSPEIPTWTPCRAEVLGIHEDYLDRRALFTGCVGESWRASSGPVARLSPILSSCLCIMV